MRRRKPSEDKVGGTTPQRFAPWSKPKEPLLHFWILEQAPDPPGLHAPPKRCANTLLPLGEVEESSEHRLSCISCLRFPRGTRASASRGILGFFTSRLRFPPVLVPLLLPRNMLTTIWRCPMRVCTGSFDSVRPSKLRMPSKAWTVTVSAPNVYCASWPTLPRKRRRFP